MVTQVWGPLRRRATGRSLEILVARPGGLSFPGSREESKRVSRLSLCLSCGGMPVCIPILGALPEGLSQLSLLGPLPAPGTVSTLISQHHLSFSDSFPFSFLSLLHLSLLSLWFFSHVAHQSEKPDPSAAMVYLLQTPSSLFRTCCGPQYLQKQQMALDTPPPASHSCQCP